MPSNEAMEQTDAIAKHAQQVAEGLLPSDSPPTFVRPEGDDALDERGLPWFYGPLYSPTPEAIAAFSMRPDATHDDGGA